MPCENAKGGNKSCLDSSGLLESEPQQLRPALERSFNSGKTSVINVIPDENIPAPQQAARMEAYRKMK